MALTIIAGGVGGGVGVALNQQSPTAVTALSSATPKVQPAALVPGSAAQVAAKVLPSVVQIQVVKVVKAVKAVKAVRAPGSCCLPTV